MAPSFQRYIGVRDFFPQEARFRHWMFSRQRQVCESYGYEEYGGPILEPLDLYRIKSSQEIVSDQLYRFRDRSGREVAIRPELTPTLARMVALRNRELSYPLRWFNIGNFMRYERPGRGRLREFFQLNVDLLGPQGYPADSEVIQLAVDILRSYGAQEEHFRVCYSDRRILESCLGKLTSGEEHLRAIGRVIDKRDRLREQQFESLLQEAAGDRDLAHRVLDMLALDLNALKELAAEEKIDPSPVFDLIGMTEHLKQLGYGSCLQFDPMIVRGFDYYTGFVFEIFDRHPQNRRAILGGGRYDHLLGLFGGRDIAAVGFGMGDVGLENCLRANSLVPSSLEELEGVFVLPLSVEFLAESGRIAQDLRAAGLPAELSLSPDRRIGKQIETALKKRRRFALLLGDREVENNCVSVKDLLQGVQREVERSRLLEYLLESQSLKS